MEPLADKIGKADALVTMAYSLAGLGLATFLAGGLGWAVSGRVLRPLRAITEAARTASQENLDQRLALAGPPDELKELADTFDAMLARLDGAFASQRRFIANASHELRTPLTEMRTLIDVSLAKPATPARQLEPALAGVRTAVDKAEELIEALLTLACSDRGLGRTEVVDLPTAVDDAIDLIRPATTARQVRIDTALQHAQVTGDRVLIERLVSNLIDNAVRHNVPDGWVLASTREQAGRAELIIASSGEPIPADQVTGLFEPSAVWLDGRATRQAQGWDCPSWHRWPRRTAATPWHEPGPMAASKCRSRCPRPRARMRSSSAGPGRRPRRPSLAESPRVRFAVACACTGHVATT
jgi:signal transduction histidine kinase